MLAQGLGDLFSAENTDPVELPFNVRKVSDLTDLDEPSEAPPAPASAQPPPAAVRPPQAPPASGQGPLPCAASAPAHASAPSGARGRQEAPGPRGSRQQQPSPQPQPHQAALSLPLAALAARRPQGCTSQGSRGQGPRRGAYVHQPSPRSPSGNAGAAQAAGAAPGSGAQAAGPAQGAAAPAPGASGSGPGGFHREGTGSDGGVPPFASALSSSQGRPQAQAPAGAAPPAAGAGGGASNGTAPPPPLAPAPSTGSGSYAGARGGAAGPSHQLKVGMPLQAIPPVTLQSRGPLPQLQPQQPQPAAALHSRGRAAGGGSLSPPRPGPTSHSPVPLRPAIHGSYVAAGPPTAGHGRHSAASAGHGPQPAPVPAGVLTLGSGALQVRVAQPGPPAHMQQGLRNPGGLRTSSPPPPLGARLAATSPPPVSRLSAATAVAYGPPATAGPGVMLQQPAAVVAGYPGGGPQSPSAAMRVATVYVPTPVGSSSGADGQAKGRPSAPPTAGAAALAAAAAAGAHVPASAQLVGMYGMAVDPLSRSMSMMGRPMVGSPGPSFVAVRGPSYVGAPPGSGSAGSHGPRPFVRQPSAVAAAPVAIVASGGYTSPPRPPARRSLASAGGSPLTKTRM